MMMIKSIIPAAAPERLPYLSSDCCQACGGDTIDCRYCAATVGLASRSCTRRGVIRFDRPGISRLAVQLPELFGHRQGFLRFRGHKGADSHGRDVNSLFPERFEQPLSHRPNPGLADADRQ